MLDGIERTDLGKLIEYLGCLRIGMISVSFASIFTSSIRQKSRNGERITFVVTLPLDELEKFRKNVSPHRSYVARSRQHSSE